jgi:hypothetical protein
MFTVNEYICSAFKSYQGKSPLSSSHERQSGPGRWPVHPRDGVEVLAPSRKAEGAGYVSAPALYVFFFFSRLRV